MRPWSLISVLLVCAGCLVRLPRPADIGIAVKTTVKVQARVEAPVVAVPIVGAPVVEFFGVPLDGAQDVVFVLDCSGSMSDVAQGRIAEIRSAGGTSVDPTAPNAPVDPSAPVDPNAPTDPNTPTDPNAPVDPNALTPPAQPAPAPTTGSRKIDVAQAELVDALEKLPVGTRMNVVFFNSDVDAFAPSMVPLEETARSGLIGFVKETVPTGSTALAPAMRIAFLMNARRIVLLSDGLGNVGGNAQSLLRDAREAMRGGVRIDTIGLGRGQDADLLGTLAIESGGLYQPL